MSEMHSQKGIRLIVMLAAPPGAGKSTLSGFLEHIAKEAISGIKVQAIGMDGFHRRQEYLTSHTTDVGGRKVLMVDIKGAPVTFDLGALQVYRDRQCAHNGILSILDAYKEKYGSYPDVVISGFHLMKKTKYADEELREIVDIGRELKKYPTMFYSCHCTGEPAYKMMEQLQYVHSGDEVKIKKWVAKKEGRSTFMKWHKFFAWATVICFFMTMITGYKKA